MKTLIVYSNSSTFRPRSVVCSLAVDLRLAGHDVTVLDTSDFDYVRQDLPPRWYARLFGQDVYPSNFNAILSEHGVEYLRLFRPSTPTKQLSETTYAALEAAVLSEVYTYINSDRPNKSSWFTRTVSKRIRDASAPLYGALREFLNEHNFTRALIPNGRVPSQRMALLACIDHGLEVGYYEIGRATENSYYLGEMQVHDRSGTQAEVEEKTRHLSDVETARIAEEWLATRTSIGLAIHPFNKTWRGGLVDEFVRKDEGQVAVFFSSSVDEFASYGSSWQNQEWPNQYDAFEAIIDFLIPRGVHCILRLHPNLVNKDRRYVSREIERVATLKEHYPDIEILSHTSPVNSYELLHDATYIFVGRSTLGLEASCLGKSVWVTTPSRYDEVADVRRIFGPSEVTEANLSPWKVSEKKAQRFVAYWVIHDHPFTFGEENWSTWDTLAPPLAMRIGNLFVKNALLHKLHLVMLEVVKLLNRLRGRRLEREQSVLRKTRT